MVKWPGAELHRYCKDCRARTVYNVGERGRVGADHVARLADAWLARERA